MSLGPYLSIFQIIAFITIPLAWVPKLESVRPQVRESNILRGQFVFWESIDEIIGVKNLLNGSIVPK